MIAHLGPLQNSDLKLAEVQSLFLAAVGKVPRASGVPLLPGAEHDDRASPELGDHTPEICAGVWVLGVVLRMHRSDGDDEALLKAREEVTYPRGIYVVDSLEFDNVGVKRELETGVWLVFLVFRANCKVGLLNMYVIIVQGFTSLSN